ncbi:(2Fe-2S)-binding protein [Ruegeria atlantica]|uniref:(2Fe-2S)-binding protein n=1 Tax=Ruegeria atlantica TaxID=81569 RepID=UPI00147EADB5|nr:(2Fe-2S)-binding protein [Ruegeria atlantica]
MKKFITINVNGQDVECAVEGRTTLGDFIRNEAKLTGTHLGCEHGVCGACTVLVDGRPMRSCITFAASLDGAHVTTTEKLGQDRIGAVLREAFHEAHGLQCGFCTPGMLVTCRDILARHKNPSEETIRYELSGNICRCTGYMNIVAAVKLAAQRLNSDEVK